MGRFARMPEEVFLDDRLSKNDLRVLGVILTFADDNGFCWPKRAQIAERCGLPVTRISTVTSNLEKLGWLKKTGDGGLSRSCSYQVTIPKTVTETVTVTDLVTVTETVTPMVTETVTPMVTETVTRIKQTIEQTIEQTNNPPTPLGRTVSNSLTVELADFDLFWQEYPRKVAKAGALKSWQKLKPDRDLAALIIAAVIAQKNTPAWLREGGLYIPHPATFLNGRRWEDEINGDRKNETYKPTGYTNRLSHASRIGAHLDAIIDAEFGSGVDIRAF